MAKRPITPPTDFQRHGVGYTVALKDGAVLHTPCTLASVSDGYLDLRQQNTGPFYVYAPGEWTFLVWRCP